jgi:hypothetical protein
LFNLLFRYREDRPELGVFAIHPINHFSKHGHKALMAFRARAHYDSEVGLIDQSGINRERRHGFPGLICRRRPAAGASELLLSCIYFSHSISVAPLIFKPQSAAAV